MPNANKVYNTYSMKRELDSTKVLKNNVFRRNVTKEIFLFDFLEK